MKYTQSIHINLPRKRVIELFDNPENLAKWQPGLLKFEHISGEPGTTGAKARLLYKMGKRETEMIETVTLRELPEKFHGTYQARGVLNIQENYFEEVDENTTKWTSTSEFKFSNLPMKVMGWLMPGAFKKQSYTFMELFKTFAESES
jgi:hypothetical protein